MGVQLHESALPIRDEVRGVCELLGLDPLDLANEGKVVVLPDAADALLSAMQAYPAGREARILEEVVAAPVGMVLLKTVFGVKRVLDMLVGAQVPRIC